MTPPRPLHAFAILNDLFDDLLDGDDADLEDEALALLDAQAPEAEEPPPRLH